MGLLFTNNDQTHRSSLVSIPTANSVSGTNRLHGPPTLVGHPPGSAGVPPAPYSCKQPAIHGHSLARRTEPAFTGISSIVPGFVRARRPRSQVVLCGRDARAPRWSCAGETPALPGGAFNRLHCLHRLIREGCQRNERCEKSLQCTRSAMEADGLIVHQQRSDASLIPGFHTNGKLCFRNESPTWTAYLGWTSTWERGRPARTLFLQTACHPRPLPCKAHRTRLYGDLFHRAGVCAGGTPALPGGVCAGGTPALPGGFCAGGTPALPGGLCAGETPALPGGLVRAGRPRSQGGVTPSSFPTHGRPLWIFLQPLRGPSWPFVDNSFYPCSSATISRAACLAFSGWPGGREMAATTGCPPPP